jgi:hypothetical protein
MLELKKLSEELSCLESGVAKGAAVSKKCTAKGKFS